MSLLQRYYDLKTIQKVSLLVGLMAIFMIVVGLTGFVFLNGLSKKFDYLYEKNLTNVNLFNNLSTTFERNKLALLRIMHHKTPAEKNEDLANIKNMKKINDELMDKISKLDMSDFEKQKFDENMKLTAEIRIYRAKLLKLAMDNQETAAYKVYDENLEGLYDKRGAVLDEIIKYNMEEAEAFDKKVIQETNNAYIIMIFTVIAALVLSIFFARFISYRIQQLLDVLAHKMEEVANGNLKVEKFCHVSKSDVGILCGSFDIMLQNLIKLVSEVRVTSEDIAASSQQMSASSDQTAQGAQQTATSTTQLAQGAQEISHNIEQGSVNISKLNNVIQGISEEAKNVVKLGNDTEINANIGADQVKNAVNKMDSIKQSSGNISVNIFELGKLSSEIETIVDLIKNIAGQTNLLALNAAIEAARAGEHGKGFAVVADEVKKLAGQSASATEKITSMIKEIQNKTHVAVSAMDKATQEVEEGVLVINDAGKALENIITQVKSANVKIQDITKEIDGVAKNSEEIVLMIENVSAVTEQTAASAEEISSITEEQTATIQEISASSNALARIAEKLNGQVSVFKI